jgi:arylsulfatase A
LQVPEDSLAEYLGKWPDPPYPGDKGYLPQFAPRAAYAAMITRFDREVGRLMDLVKELGLDANTIFVFTSDNGPLNDRYGGTDTDFFASAGPLRGFKGSLYEGGFRVPMMVRWTGHVAAGTTSGRVTGFEDWMPTLLELVGAAQATPAGIDGISFAATLRGQPQPERPYLYREFPGYGGQQLVRMGDWVGVRQKLKPAGKNGKPRMQIELYNLKEDLAEQQDVAAEHADVVAKIERLMREQHSPSEEFPMPALDR